MSYQLEIIAYNLDACLRAQTAGAHRIELCANPGEGGTTPAYGFIKKAREMLNIELYVMIRPRGGDFLYSAEEFEMMKSDIQLCKQLGCDGVVTGILNADGSINKDRCFQLVELAYPLGVTFHRAFDRTNDPFKALDDIIELGFERVLTSGLRSTALKGAKLLCELVKRAADQIIIMPGSGIRAGNLGEIAEKTGATSFHSSASATAGSQMHFLNRQFKTDDQTVTVDAGEITKMRKVLAHLPSPSPATTNK